MKKRQIEQWHTLLKKDCYRNDILIPYLINEFKNHSNRSVLDIGSGTGYIHESIFRSTKKNIKTYYSLDKNHKMLKFANRISKIKKHNNVKHILSDFLNFKKSKKFDYIILSFTLLELKINAKFCKKLKSHLKKNGKVIIFLPDVLQDIMKKENIKYNYLENYINNTLLFNKKINGSEIEFPFLINRFENLLEKLTTTGFIVFNLFHKKCLNKKSFIIEFKHKNE